MKQRLDYAKVAPGAIGAMMRLEEYVGGAWQDRGLLHLIKLRASQLNGCAYCVDMHSKESRAAGEDQQRLDALPVWREVPFFDDRERAALEWTEALTRVGEGGVSDALYARVREHFSEAQVVDLTLAIVAINGWNRVAIAFRPPVGGYRPPMAVHA